MGGWEGENQYIHHHLLGGIYRSHLDLLGRSISQPSLKWVYVGQNEVHLLLEQTDRIWFFMYVEMIQHSLHTYKAWTPYGSLANTGMHTVQFNIRSGKTRAGSVHRDCGLCMADLPDSGLSMLSHLWEVQIRWFYVCGSPWIQCNTSSFTGDGLKAVLHLRRSGFGDIVPHLQKLDSLFLIVLLQAADMNYKLVVGVQKRVWCIQDDNIVPAYLNVWEMLLYSSSEHRKVGVVGILLWRKGKMSWNPKQFLHQVCYWHDFSLQHHRVSRNSWAHWLLELLIQA